MEYIHFWKGCLQSFEKTNGIYTSGNVVSKASEKKNVLIVTKFTLEKNMNFGMLTECKKV